MSKAKERIQQVLEFWQQNWNYDPWGFTAHIVEYLVETEEEHLVFEIEKNGYALRRAKNAEKRKECHQWADRLGYGHFGYVNSLEACETIEAYKCPICNRWMFLKNQERVIHFCCCTDAKGEPACRDDWYECRACWLKGEFTMLYS